MSGAVQVVLLLLGAQAVPLPFEQPRLYPAVPLQFFDLFNFDLLPDSLRAGRGQCVPSRRFCGPQFNLPFFLLAPQFI